MGTGRRDGAERASEYVESSRRGDRARERELSESRRVAFRGVPSGRAAWPDSCSSSARPALHHPVEPVSAMATAPYVTRSRRVRSAKHPIVALYITSMILALYNVSSSYNCPVEW